MSNTSWKANFEAAREHHFGWWDQKGLILNTWGSGFGTDRAVNAQIGRPSEPSDFEAWHTDPDYVSRHWEHDISQRVFPADVLPVAPAGFGTVELAAYLGVEMTFQKDMIWYKHVITDPDKWPAMKFDPDNVWFRRMEETLRKSVALADGRYMIGMPAIAPNLDVLAELRGTEELMMDFFDRPGWIKDKLDEIDEAYFEVYEKFYDIIKLEDNSSLFYFFMLWAPGKVTLLQGDVAAMISEDMFREYMVPGLTKASERIDYSMFHVDGPGMIKHIDALCEIEALNALQFTPGPQVPSGGDKHWYEMYRKVLASGKSMQIGAEPEEVLPLLDAIGTDGVYLMVNCNEAEILADLEQKIRG